MSWLWGGRRDTEASGEFEESGPVVARERDSVAESGGACFAASITRQSDAIDAGFAGSFPDGVRELVGLSDEMIGSMEQLGIPDDEEDVVGFELSRFGGRGGTSGESGREDIDEKSEAEAFEGLIASQREERTRGIGGDGAGVGGGVSLGILDPAEGDLLSGEHGDPDFASGNGAGGHIEDDRFCRGRGREGERVGADAGFESSGGGDVAEDAVVVDGEPGGESFLGGDFDPFPKATDMSRAAHGSAGETGPSGFVADEINESAALNLSEAEAAVGDEHGGGFPDDLEFGIGEDFTALHLGGVIDDAVDPVGIVTVEVGLDEAGGDQNGILRGYSGRLKEVSGKLMQDIRLEGGHVVIP